MDEHQSTYRNKFAVDPYRRDNVFRESQALQLELHASQKQRKQFASKVVSPPEDFNQLNVVKADCKSF